MYNESALVDNHFGFSFVFSFNNQIGICKYICNWIESECTMKLNINMYKKKIGADNFFREFFEFVSAIRN